MEKKTSGFTLDRQMNELRFRSVTLASKDWLAKNYVRIRLRGDDLAGFESPGADDHIRLFFPARPAETLEELREAPSREYTPLAWGDDWLDIEFVVHGDEGVAGLWAADAAVGAQIGVGGPRGSMLINGTPGAWFLAGDETAIPAIRRFAALIPGGIPAQIVIEVPGKDDEVEIEAPVDVLWLHRHHDAAGSALASYLHGRAASDALDQDPFVFIAAEQAIVKPGRALLQRWNVSVEKAVVKGYWKRGEAEYHAPH